MPRRCELGCRPLTGAGVPTHMFPNPKKFPETFKAWVEIVGGTLKSPDHYTYYKRRMICDIHFTDRDKNRNHRLNALAVPTLYLPGNDQPRQCNALERIHFDHDYCKTTSYSSGPEAPQDYAGDELSCESFDTDVPVEWSGAHVVAPFSWQQPSAVVPCIADAQEEDRLEYELICDNESGERVGQPKDTRGAPDPGTPEEDVRARYLCNACEQHIEGCRYVCVQCVDWDLCGVCEAAGRHPAHYVLRVPEGKQKDAVEAVLQTIRRAITDCIVHIKEEEIKVKEETDQEDPIAVKLGEPCIRGLGGLQDGAPVDPAGPRADCPVAAVPTPDDDNKIFGKNSTARRKKTDPPMRTKKKSSKVTLKLESNAGFYVAAKRLSNNTQKQETCKKSSDTKVVTLPVVRVSRGNRSGASLVTSHGRDVTKHALTSSDVDVETSRAVVPVPARSVTLSAGRKRPVTEKVPGMTSPERKKVATVLLERLTKEEIMNALSKS